MGVPLAAPNTGNYQIGKGELWFTLEGGQRRHLGNVPEVEINLEPETLEHFSSMAGIRAKDLEVIVEQQGTVTLLLEEITPENVAMMMLGTAEEATDGAIEINIYSLNEIVGRLEFQGTNEVGPRYSFDLPRVSFRPNGEMPWIGNEFSQLPIQGELLRHPTLGFGKIRVTTQPATEAATEPPTG